MDMSQLIIARKDLHMSPGKLAAQVSHASMTFLTNKIEGFQVNNKIYCYIQIDNDTWNNWVKGSFTKIVCEAKNKNQLLKVIEIASSLGLKENIDYYLIRDNCLTELTPEEFDENGVGRTLTCIGFRPLPKDICKQLSKKYQLYK